MAHLQKYKSEATHAILDHCARSRSGTLERDNIDRSRTPLNLTLGASDPEVGKAAVLDRIKAVKESHTKITKKKVRADAVEFGDWIITAPQSLPENRHQEFFNVTFEFLQQRYGAENVPCGFVHLDESQPHMHCPIVPEKAGKLNGKAVFNRKDLQSFHGDLQNRLEKELSCHVEIVLDDDKVLEKALSVLPSKEFRQTLNLLIDEVDELDKKREQLETEIDSLRDTLSDLEGLCYDTEREAKVFAAEKERLKVQTQMLATKKDDLDAQTRALAAEKEHLEIQTKALENGVKNPLAQAILEIRDATETAYALYGEYQELEHSAWAAQYGDFSDMRAEPVQLWDDRMCEVQIVKSLFKEPVVQMSVSQWETLKDAHNRLVSAYKDAISVLKDKVLKLVDFLKKMPEHVPQYFKLEELHKKLARYDLMDRERYAKAAKAGREEAEELTQKAINGQRVQRPTLEERLQRAKEAVDKDVARSQTQQKKKKSYDIER